MTIEKEEEILEDAISDNQEWTSIPDEMRRFINSVRNTSRALSDIFRRNE